VLPPEKEDDISMLCLPPHLKP